MKVCTVLVLTFFLACVSIADAGLIPISVSAGDGDVRNTGGIDTSGSPGVFVGRVSSGGDNTRSAILPFELPVIPFGETILSANLFFSSQALGSGLATPVAGDLYGLDFRVNDAIVSSDYFLGLPGTDPNATLIDAGTLQPGMPAIFTDLNTDAAADIALADYLNDQITGGAAAGDFVFLRFSPTNTQSGARNFRIRSSETGMGAVLTIVTGIPEPSTLALLLVGSVACCCRVRRAPSVANV